MKTSKSLWLAAGLVCAVVPSAVVKAETPAANGAAGAVASALSIPDFKTASVADLASVASQALGGLSSAAGSAPALLEKVKVVQAALSGGKALDAVTALAGLSEAAKAVPGAAKLAETAKQVVSAWALKQGFDATKISGVLGALQKKDLGSLASKAAGLLNKGGLTGDQTGLLNGVLGAYGVDASKAAGAASAVKGLLGN